MLELPLSIFRFTPLPLFVYNGRARRAEKTGEKGEATAVRDRNMVLIGVAGIKSIRRCLFHSSDLVSELFALH